MFDLGMYDYIGGEQIKIFPVPILYNNQLSFSSGRLNSYGEQDELPLKTLYYQYPDNFLVHDYRFAKDEEFNHVWVFKNQRFSHFTKVDTLTEVDLVGPVFDYYGNRLSIKTIADFRLIFEERKLAFQLDKELELKIFPKGMIRTIKEDIEYYRQKEKEWDELSYQHSKAFSKKWYAEEPYGDEEHFGAVIQCIIDAKNKAGEESNLYFDPKKTYEECLAYAQEFLNNHPTIISSFQTWYNDDAHLSAIGFEDLLTEINQFKPIESS